jgi:hypothetical protein
MVLGLVLRLFLRFVLDSATLLVCLILLLHLAICYSVVVDVS